MVWARFGEHCGGQRDKGVRLEQSGVSVQPLAEGEKGHTAGWHLEAGQHNLGLVHPAPCHRPKEVRMCAELSWGWYGFFSSLETEVSSLWVIGRVCLCQFSDRSLVGLPLWPYRVDARRMVFSQGVFTVKGGQTERNKIVLAPG